MGHLQPLKTIYKPIPSLIIRNWPQVLLKDESGKLQLIRKCKYPVTPKTIKGLFTFTLKKKKMATSGHSENCLARTVTPQLSEIHQVRHKCSREDTGKSSKHRDGKKGAGGGLKSPAPMPNFSVKPSFAQFDHRAQVHAREK